MHFKGNTKITGCWRNTIAISSMTSIELGLNRYANYRKCKTHMKTRIEQN